MTEHRQNQPASPRRQQRQPFHTFQYDTTASLQQQQQEGETFHFQLLRRQEHEARQNFRNLRPSSIPWSPGQTLAGQSTFHRPLLSPHQSHSDDDAARCWNWMTCHGCHSCCRSSSSSRNNRRRDETGVYSHPQYQQQHQQEPGSTARSCYNFVYIFLYVLTFGGLYHYASRCSHQAWTMHPGESRHAATAGFLTNSVQVMSHQEQRSVSPRNNNNGTDSDDVESRGIAVYAVGSRECPPLTGPPVILHSPSQELVLLHNAFEYQYFYLNKGSIMSVTAHQIIGATNILVLKGSKVLARIQGQQPGSNNNNNRHTTFMDALFNKVVSSLDFSTEEIMLEQLSWAQDDKGPVEFSFTSPSSDVYVLLYDNAAANEAATLEVQYDMDLKTYNLEGMVPWCSHSAPVPASYSSNNQQVLTPSFIPEDQTATSFTCPPMETSTAGCIIVEAIQHTEDHSQNSTTDNSTTVSYSTFMGLGEGLVEVTVYTTQNWFYIGGLSLLLPSFLASWWYCRRLRNRHRMHTYYHGDEYQDPVHRQHRERSMRPPSRQRQDGPNYHFLPPHHDDQDGSGHEQDTTAQVHGEHEDNTDGEQSKGRLKREGRDPESTEVLQEDETTVIPAENILILQNNETLSE